MADDAALAGDVLDRACALQDLHGAGAANAVRDVMCSAIVCTEVIQRGRGPIVSVRNFTALVKRIRNPPRVAMFIRHHRQPARSPSRAAMGIWVQSLLGHMGVQVPRDTNPKIR